MSFDLGKHAGGRNRSVDLGTRLLFLNPSPIAEPSPRTSRDSRRSTSLPLGHLVLTEDDRGSSRPFSLRTSTVRHHRSMLDADRNSRLILDAMTISSANEQHANSQQNETVPNQQGEPSRSSANSRMPSWSDSRFASSQYSWSQDLPNLSLRIILFLTFIDNLLTSINSFSRQRVPSVGTFCLARQR